MVRINLKTGKVIEEIEFSGPSAEKKLQKIVEEHMPKLLHAYFLKSFHSIPGGEIDTLAITEDGAPCIVEYKTEKDETVLNQAVFYYDWLSSTGKFEFEKIVRENAMRKTKVNWSEKPRLICIAKKFSKWDYSLLNHLDVDIELFTYGLHEDEFELNMVKGVKRRRIPRREQQLEKLNLEYHKSRAKGNTATIEMLDELRDKTLKLGNDVEEGFAPDYIKYFVNSSFLTVHVRQKHLWLHLRVNEKTFSDPRKIAKDISDRGWSTTREVKLSSKSDIPYVMKLLKQAYDYQFG